MRARRGPGLTPGAALAMVMGPGRQAELRDAHPAFATLADVAGGLRVADSPTPAVLDAILAAGQVRNARGLRLRALNEHALGDLAGLRYEPRILDHGVLSVRPGDVHDLLNVLVWLRFPLTKAALNRRHCEELEQHAHEVLGRGPVRDALTLVDESGVLVAASDSSLLDGIRAFRWKEVFWTRRAQLHARLRMHVFGHGLYDQLRRPFVGLIGHGILLGVDQTVIEASPSEQLSALDAMLATAIGDPSCLRSPRDLQPVPLLGMPGWHEETASERFYDNVAYFRPGRNNHGARSVS